MGTKVSRCFPIKDIMRLHLPTVAFSTDQENWSSRSSDFMRHVIRSCQNPRHLALTFDDGVGPYTGRLLDILRHSQVRATFFILGNTLAPETLYAEHHKHILVRMVREGHVIGSHTYNHPDLTNLRREDIRSQLRRTDQLIQSVIGVRPRFIRPPYGYVNQKVVDTLRKDGYFPVTWNQDTNDWKHQDNYSAILAFVKESIPKADKSEEGPILLQHDTLKSSLILAPKIIKILRKKGYAFVTIDECIGQLPYRV